MMKSIEFVIDTKGNKPSGLPSGVLVVSETLLPEHLHTVMRPLVGGGYVVEHKITKEDLR